MKKKDALILGLIITGVLVISIIIYLLVPNNLSFKISTKKMAKETTISLTTDKEYSNKLVFLNKGRDTNTYKLSLTSDDLKEINGYFVYVLSNNNEVISQGIINSDITDMYSLKLDSSERKECLLEIFYYNDSNMNNSVKLDVNLTLELEEQNNKYSMLKDGYTVNSKMKELANNGKVYEDKKIKKIKLSNKIPNKYKTEEYVVSTADSKEPIYMWYDKGIINFYSTNKIKLNKDSSDLFSDLYELVDINDLRYFDYSIVEDMHGFFSGDKKLSDIKAVGYFNTEKSLDISSMFSYCESLTNIYPIVSLLRDLDGSMGYLLCSTSVSDINVLRFANTKNVIIMSDLFSDSKIVDVSPIAKWDVSNVTDMYSMFNATRVADFSPIADWNVSNLEDMGFMFGYASIKNVDFLFKWDVSKVKNMSYMFYSCRNLVNIDGLKNWKTTSLEKINFCFKGTKLTNVDALANFNTSKVTNMQQTFNMCRKLKNINGLKNWNTANVIDMEEMFAYTAFSDTSALSNWNTAKVTTMKNIFSRSKISNVNGLKKWNVTSCKDFSGAFYMIPMDNVDELTGWTSHNANYTDYFKHYEKSSNV